ncbi:MAG: hypothetical protein Ct9H90mP16_18300 [Candidatus Poseidoniales archaeon]|nr:MAG: hypothetical protein Ct9H90mP16_18300 [Candidatus Poseidoniales archaeon]
MDTYWKQMTLDECEVISGSNTVTSTSETVLDCGTVEEDLRIVGMPTIHLSATLSPLCIPSQISCSGHLFVDMQRGSDGSHLGHAVMDLRFADGGKDGKILFPGETVLAKMEFFGMDVVLEEGDNLILVITQTGRDYVPSAASTLPVTVSLGGESTLSLSTVDRTCNDLFLPPMQDAYPQCE